MNSTAEGQPQSRSQRRRDYALRSGRTSNVATSTALAVFSRYEGPKTQRSRREVPLTSAALAALDSLPARLDSPYLFAGPKGGPFGVANFRRREWRPAIESAGIEEPARIYDLRSTFASNALAAGITVYELARIMGTSVSMIEAHYGALLDTAHDGILERLDRTDSRVRP